MNERETQTIIVDLDGPILDVRERHFYCYETIMSGLNAPTLAIDAYWAVKRSGVTVRRILSETRSETHEGSFSRQWAARIEDPDLLKLDTVQPLARETLTRWKRHGKTIILATMRRARAAAHDQLQKLELTPLFDRVVICDSPDSTAAAKASAVMAEFESCGGLWIGDTELDARAGRLAGCSVALLTCGLRSSEVLQRECPEQLVASLSAVHL